MLLTIILGIAVIVSEMIVVYSEIKKKTEKEK
jgi:hypothetical protein